METENKAWKLTDGGMAWCMMGCECVEVLVINYPRPSHEATVTSYIGTRRISTDLLFPTAKTAMESIKARDYSGKIVEL